MTAFSLGGDLLVLGEHHPHAGDDQEAAEEPDHPLEPEQERAQGDEDAAEDEGAQDPEEQHAVLVAARHARSSRHDDEHEDVVDGERVLDHVAGQELQSGGLVRGRRRVEAGDRHEPRVRGEADRA